MCVICFVCFANLTNHHHAVLWWCVFCVFLCCVRVCSSPHTPSAPFSLSPHLLTHRGERRREKEPLSLSLMKGDKKQRMRKEVVCVLSSSLFFYQTHFSSLTLLTIFSPFLSLFLSPLSFSSLSFTQFSKEQNIKVGGKGWCFVSIKEQILGNTTIESRGIVGERGGEKITRETPNRESDVCGG